MKTRSSLIRVSVVFACLTPVCLAQDAPILPKLPQKTVDTTYPAVTGRSIAVRKGDSLQNAINSANCGDELVLQAGAVFKGNFTLPAKGCTAARQILIRTSAISKLKPGHRAQGSDARFMPSLLTRNINPVITIADDA